MRTAAKLISTLPIGEGVDATAFDPETGLAFASCGEGVLTVVREDSPNKFSVDRKCSDPARGAHHDARCREAPDISGDREIRAASGPDGGAASPVAPILPDSFVVLVVGR